MKAVGLLRGEISHPGLEHGRIKILAIVRTLCSSTRHRILYVAALGRVSVVTCYRCNVASIAFVHSRDRDDLVFLMNPLLFGIAVD